MPKKKYIYIYICNKSQDTWHQTIQKALLTGN